MIQGDNVTIDVNESTDNTSRRKKKKIMGAFIKDYGNYIQIMDKFGIRRSIMKQDIIKIKVC